MTFQNENVRARKAKTTPTGCSTHARKANTILGTALCGTEYPPGGWSGGTSPEIFWTN